MRLIKDVNRELFEQINQKDYIIGECKKIYEKCLPRHSQEFQLMRKILEHNWPIIHDFSTFVYLNNAI